MLMSPVAPVEVKWDISLQVNVHLKHPQENLARTPQDWIYQRPWAEGVAEAREKQCSSVAGRRTLVCICVAVPMLLLSHFPEVENCNSRVLPYGQPCWLHWRDQNPLDIALLAWKLIHNHWIRTNNLGLLRCKPGHRSEDNVCQSPHPNKHTQMCANENWSTTLNWGLIWT